MQEIVEHAHHASGGGLALLVRARLVSFELVWGIGFVLVVSLALDAAINFVGHMMFGDSKLLIVAAIVQAMLRLVVLGAAFTARLRWLPNAPVQFKHAGAGAAVSAVLFTLGHSLFGLY